MQRPEQTYNLKNCTISIGLKNLNIPCYPFSNVDPQERERERERDRQRDCYKETTHTCLTTYVSRISRIVREIDDTDERF